MRLRRRGAGSERGTRSELLTRALKILLLAIVYYVVARLSLRLALVAKNVTPLWPPTGIAVVSFLVLGWEVWPAIALGAFLVNAPISSSLLAAAATAAGNTLAPFVAARSLIKVGFRRQLDRLRDAIAIVFLAALGSMLISASVGAGTLALSGAIPASDFLGAWAVWWTGDAMGVLVVAPFLLSLLLFREHRRTSWRRRAEAVGLFSLITAVSLLVVQIRLPLMFLVLPLLGWAAWRFQQRGAAPAALLVAGVATWAAGHGLGLFADRTLFENMLTLQAFNASVAITSFVFAALVTERMRARESLEESAVQLEDRVRWRTSQLSGANERLQQSERQLAEAQQVARMGSWEWLIPEDRVTWSDEMYRIHGHQPGEFSLDLAKAVEQIVEEDLQRIRRNMDAAFRKGRDHDLPRMEYRIRRTNGEERVLLGKARLTLGSGEKPLRMVGTVQDITEDKLAERRHRIAETLQRSLLPDQLPEIPGVSLAARYVPATADMEVGGDWYDVVQLPSGQVAVAIGDVAGHGLRAASTMGQLRMALRAYALEEASPAEVVGRVHRLVQKLLPSEMATLVYLVFDPESGRVTLSNAGHPPPLVIPADGEPSYRRDGLAPPLGAAPRADLFAEATFELVDGSTLLLFTDGLVERRGLPIEQELDRLMHEAAAQGPDLDALCDHLLEVFVGSDVDDDVALLALRPVPLPIDAFQLRLPAQPRALAPMRRTLRRWLRQVDASPRTANEILLACGEACTNAIQHAYGAGEGFLEIELHLLEGRVEATVRDFGSWRPFSPSEWGRGMLVMRRFMDDVQVDSGSGGTTVRMRRQLRLGAS
jgi:PAS domain S-box-containing protein